MGETAVLPDPATPTFSVVVPLFNEGEVLPRFHARLSAVMDGLGKTWEAIYVDDGSTDGSHAVLDSLRGSGDRIRIIRLSRNFGKEAALTAGLDHAAGDAVVVIDADLQDPPEVIPQLVAAWHEGFDVAYAQRTHRDGETWLKKASAKAFYRLMGRIGPVAMPADTGDFRLMSRRAVDALLKLRERHRMMKGLFAWIGFPSKAVPYRRAPRAAGSGKWGWWKLVNLSIEGITGFTVVPLRVSTFMGVVSASLAMAYAAWIVVLTTVHGNPVPGYPSLLAAVLFMGGVQLVSIGILGEYIGRIFNESKSRPLYVIQGDGGPGRE